jgi:hypothetical protein
MFGTLPWRHVRWHRKLALAIPGAHSLKAKRTVIRRVKDRVCERIGIAIIDVGRSTHGNAPSSGARSRAGMGPGRGAGRPVIREVMAASDGQVTAVARDATFDTGPAPTAIVDDRTGSGDNAAGKGDEVWVPEAWRDDQDS